MSVITKDQLSEIDNYIITKRPAFDERGHMIPNEFVDITFKEYVNFSGYEIATKKSINLIDFLQQPKIPFQYALKTLEYIDNDEEKLNIFKKILAYNIYDFCNLPGVQKQFIQIKEYIKNLRFLLSKNTKKNEILPNNFNITELNEHYENLTDIVNHLPQIVNSILLKNNEKNRENIIKFIELCHVYWDDHSRKVKKMTPSYIAKHEEKLRNKEIIFNILIGQVIPFILILNSEKKIEDIYIMFNQINYQLCTISLNATRNVAFALKAKELNLDTLPDNIVYEVGKNAFDNYTKKILEYIVGLLQKN